MSEGLRLLLAHSFFLALDGKQSRKMRPYPPLATLITAAALRSHGHEIALFDAMLAKGVGEFESLVAAERFDAVLLLEDSFNFLTKMCTTRMREAALSMIRAAKERGVPVAASGPDAADHPDLYLSAGADAVLLGETERTAPELVEAWATASQRLAGIAGLALPAEGGLVHRTPPRPFLEDLDALPLPAWDLVDIPRYRATWLRAHGRFSWNAVTTRGCPYRCNWCAKPLYGTRYAQRSPGTVAEELSALKARVRPDHVWFADDIFGLTPRWIESFAEEVARRDARIPFTMQSRVDLMAPSAVEALAEAGCEEVWMGVESGSQKILDSMEKGTRVEQARRATRLLKQHGIRPSWFLQLGYTGETWEEILATRDLLRAERPHDIGVSVSYPLPGTAFYDRVRSQMQSQTNWSDTDELAMLFEGTYTSPLYRAVRDLLHAEAPLLAGQESPLDAAAIEAAWADLSRREAEFRSARSLLPSSAESREAAAGF
ncbi:MAG: B12-binding domain-containing radical SAM protein [Thermoanaerobaculia bacterium]